LVDPLSEFDIPEECDGRAERSARRKSATRHRILEAAIRVFAEKGYRDSAVDDIVRASSTSKGAVYSYFPNKQGIFLELVDHLAGLLIQAVESSIAAEKGGINKVDGALRAVIEAFAAHRSLARILLIEVVGLGYGLDQKLPELRTRLAGVIKAHLDDAVAEGSIPPQDTEIAAYAWLGAINEVIVHWLHFGQPDPLESALPALRVFLLRSIGFVETDSRPNHPASAAAENDGSADQAASRTGHGG